MASVGKIARRTFLIGSAAIAGGVAFGAYMVNRPIPNPLLDDLADGEAAITPFIKITQEGVTLITPRADKGQGSYSIQAHLIAEELDIEWIEFFMDGVALNDDLLLDDRIHPNAEAQPLLLDNAWPVIRATLDAQ